ncbi:MAG: C13 family peptidase [Caldilineaceae bacterium]
MNKLLSNVALSLVSVRGRAQKLSIDRYSMGEVMTLVCIACLVLLAAMRQRQVVAQSQNYSLTRGSIANGGVGGATHSAGGVYTVQGAIGQPLAGALTANSYTIDGGFWHKRHFITGTDTYEPNNDCQHATTIPVDGTVQQHGFEVTNDNDWVTFNTVAGANYLVEASRALTSTADVVMAVYSDCNTLSDTKAYTYTPEIRLEFAAPKTGPLWLKLTNQDPAVAGAKVRYALSVRALDASPAPTASALIVVAGRLKRDDTIQANIYHVTDEVYQLFRQQGYGDDRIYYLAPDLDHRATDVTVDALATADNLHYAITEWAKSQVGAQGALTLYLMDHGDRGKFYLDGVNGETVTPAQLDQWLSEVESANPNSKVNVIVEMCYAGSFIKAATPLSKAGRVIIASTSDNFVAWASAQGAIFSDYLLASLQRKSSLGVSFTRAREAALAYHREQSPWLDANGNGEANETADFEIANRRGFDFPGTFTELWPPHIAEVEGPSAIVNQQGTMRATVLDDQGIRHVWALIYPPDYMAPTTSDALVNDEADERVTKLGLTRRSGDLYSATFFGFNQAGSYRILIYAEDDDNLQTPPVAITVDHQVSRVFLPLVAQE